MALSSRGDKERGTNSKSKAKIETKTRALQTTYRHFGVAWHIAEPYKGRWAEYYMPRRVIRIKYPRYI